MSTLRGRVVHALQIGGGELGEDSSPSSQRHVTSSPSLLKRLALHQNASGNSNNNHRGSSSASLTQRASSSTSLLGRETDDDNNTNNNEVEDDNATNTSRAEAFLPIKADLMRFWSAVRGRRRTGVLSQNHNSQAAPNNTVPFKSLSSFEGTATTTVPVGTTALNVMQFLENACPQDVLPKILAYCGPQKTAVLSRTNRHWKNLIAQEMTWRVLCEELYKWKKGDPEPESWAELYRSSPCVPIDYPTVRKALATVEERTNQRRQAGQNNFPVIHKGIRILLRPGEYALKECIHLNIVEGALVSIETMVMPDNIFRPPIKPKREQPPEAPAPPKRLPSLSCLMRCSRSSRHLVESSDPSWLEQQQNQDPTETETETDRLEEWGTIHEVPPAASATAAAAATAAVQGPPPPKRATLTLRSRRHNEPAIRVRQGHFKMVGVEVVHNSHGIDIWNGNAAIQVQPPTVIDDDEDEEDGQPPRPRPVANPLPTVWLDEVHITSRSGRGVVNIDGGRVNLRRCAVTDCAATGVYVGGPGSEAVIESSDVVHNGLGNRQRRGIARGHSGIYLEQGVARIVDCNIGANTLTGISAVSPENAILTLENCDLVSNGTFQLEMPSPGTRARQHSVLVQNNMSVHGPLRPRTEFVKGRHTTATRDPFQQAAALHAQNAAPFWRAAAEVEPGEI